MASRNAVLASLKVLQLRWKDIAENKGSLAFWEIGLGPYTDQQLAVLTELVVRYHRFGKPVPGNFASMQMGHEEQELTESVYAVAYRSVRRFIWEEAGHEPPGGLSAWEARAILEAPREPLTDHLPSGATIRAGSPQRLSGLLEEGQ